MLAAPFCSVTPRAALLEATFVLPTWIRKQTSSYFPRPGGFHSDFGFGAADCVCVCVFFFFCEVSDFLDLLGERFGTLDLAWRELEGFAKL